MMWFTYVNRNGIDCLWPSLQVAVLTKPPTLEGFCLLDANAPAETRWLEAHGVTVVPWAVSFPDALRRNYPDRFHVATGAYLRFEIPTVCEQLGITDRYLLTTDMDVMFAGDVSSLASVRPAYLAAAPQFDPNDWSYFNSGVMVINRQAFAEQLPRLIACIPKLRAGHGFDQDTLNLHFAGRWHWLPVEYNWKPWWGVNPNARIVHFHGPKAHTCEPVEGEADMQVIRKHTSAEQLVREMRKGGFAHYSAIWMEHYEQI